MPKTNSKKPATQEDDEDDFEGGQEVQSNWFKFSEVGDKIKGTLLSKKLQPATDPTFPDQWVYRLRTAAGQVFNVGIAVNKPGTVERMNNCKLGEIVGILFEKEGEQKKKGFAKAKYLKILSFGMDESFKDFEDEHTDKDDGDKSGLPNFDANDE